MSTRNFYAKCDKYFATETDENTDEFLFDDIMENVLSELKDFDPVKEWTHDLRSYEGRIFGRIGKTYYNKSDEWSVKIDLIIRSGYYTGLNLDYDVIYLNGTNEEDYQYLLDYAPKYIVDRIDKWVNKTCDRIEKVFIENSDMELELMATLSNGEGVYRKIGKGGKKDD